MKIELSRAQSFTLTHDFAQTMHHQLIELHLRAIDKIDGRDVPRDLAGLFAQERADLRAAIASIEDAWDRRDFVLNVRHLFHKLRAERGTEPTSRAYVAKVLAYRESERRAE